MTTKKPLKQKIKDFFINLWGLLKRELKDWKSWVIFVIVCIVVSSEVWVMYLLYFITKNLWFLGVANACWAFWLAPFPAPPFIPICLAITVGIKSLFNKIRSKKKKNGR